MLHLLEVVQSSGSGRALSDREGCRVVVVNRTVRGSGE